MEHKLWIDGGWVDSQGGGSMSIENPAWAAATPGIHRSRNRVTGGRVRMDHSPMLRPHDRRRLRGTRTM